ncbi:MAG: RelA/SpoT family protein [Bacteroidaceae bacterium]|nr:RelA/SpoT family protein [Bacteroidaceae bacterium]
MANDNLFSPEEEKRIDEAFETLVKTYLQSPHRKKVDLITKAFNFARQAHHGVRRHSGEPYIMHPLAVAQIVSGEIGLGSTSICAALLHDVVEDTDYTTDDIKVVFGPKIAQIVDGLTKIAGGIFGEKASAQAENFKKLLLTMSDDIRVILVKIADRLHNMRTLEYMQERKQYKIAGETLYLYAPLAYRLGLNNIKTELEDLAFRYEHPVEYKEITEQLEVTRAQRDKMFDQFTKPIVNKLKAMGIEFNITSRTKEPYSIWKKMNAQGVRFDEVYDILAVRIIYKPLTPESELTDCFNIYLALTELYKSHPDRLRDWVTLPKANGYQALHVTLMSSFGYWVEVQIRSERMDDIAEHGIAAHWKYKNGNKDDYEDKDSQLGKWLETIKEILEDPQPDSMDFLDTIKLNLYSTEIFIFTPKGEIITMPQGSTVLDFAFVIHSFLGNHCIGAKVNHKLESLNYELNSGDQVEILTSKNQNIRPEWVEYVTTAKAKSKIQSALRKEARTNRRFGEALFNEFLQKEDLKITDALMQKIIDAHHLPDRDSYMMAVGQKQIILGSIEKDIIKDSTSSGFSRFWKQVRGGDSQKEEQKATQITPQFSDTINIKKGLVITDANVSQCILSDCCMPVPGDDCMAFIDDKKNICIHRRTCAEATKIQSGKGNSITTVKWDILTTLFPTKITVEGVDGIATLHKMTHIISEKHGLNIIKLSIETAKGMFKSEIQMLVKDKNSITKVMNDLKKLENVKMVARLEK